jgi:hypothetical protein
MNNRIKITDNCCVHCGKTYKKRENLDKHIIFCDLIKNSKKIVLEDDDELVIPSQKNMYLMLIELGKKYNNLEEKMTEMTKWVSKKKKKINVVEWLNTNIEPKIVFESIMMDIHVTEQDAMSMLDNSFYDVFYEILSHSPLFCLEDKPIFALNCDKANTIYIYQMIDGNKCWILASREKLAWLFNKIHMKLVDVFYSWKKVKILEPGLNKDKFETASDKAIIKLMNVDFRVESIFSKTRTILFNGLKTDMKAFVEYEFVHL